MGSANIAECAAAAGPEPLKPLVIIWKRSHCVPMCPELCANEAQGAWSIEKESGQLAASSRQRTEDREEWAGWEIRKIEN